MVLLQSDQVELHLEIIRDLIVVYVIVKQHGYLFQVKAEEKEKRRDKGFH